MRFPRSGRLRLAPAVVLITLLGTLNGCGLFGNGSGGSAGPGMGTATTGPDVTARPWSDPATWAAFGSSKPVAGGSVKIPAGQSVMLDEDVADLGGITVEGRLEFAERDLSLTADWIMVHAGGTLRIGTPERPRTHRATITLDAGNPDENVMEMGTRGIFVHGGRLELHAAAPSPVWTRLGAHAAKGATKLTLDRPVNWRAGNTAVVAPTGFWEKSESEQTAVKAVNGSTVDLAEGLDTARWGTLQYVTPNGMSQTRPAEDAVQPPVAKTPEILDERAEVANLSRPIVIQGADDKLWRDRGFGAKVMVMDRASHVRLDGVELRRVGQQGVTGGYPVHFHMISYDRAGKELGDFPAVVRNSAIWNSANRCVVLHATNGVTVENNVCYNIAGHAFFLEDGVERRNVLKGNLALKTRTSAKPLMRHEVDGGHNPQGGASGFWLTNPDNVVTDNVGADAQGNGLWMAFSPKPTGLSTKVAIRPNHLKFGTFDRNTAHSNRGPGINLDWVVDEEANIREGAPAGSVRPLAYIGNEKGIEDWQGNLTFTMTANAVWKNAGGGVWNRAYGPKMQEWVVADNLGHAFAGSSNGGYIKGNLIVAETTNDAPKPWTWDHPVAAASYHSSMDIPGNVIVNFTLRKHDDGSYANSGAFATVDYYITAVDKGLIRNKDNVLINSHPGYRQPSPNLTPSMTAFNQAYALAGALWDPHGVWGPKGNYWMYDHPFLTHGAKCVAVAPAGQNGVSCDGTYYGIGVFDGSGLPGEVRMPIHVTNNANNAVWEIRHGNHTPMLWNMRHFAAKKGGSYTLRFGSEGCGAGADVIDGYCVPKENVTFDCYGFVAAGDETLIAVSFSGASEVRTAYFGTHEDVKKADGANRRNMTPAGSKEEVAASGGDRYWQDKANNLVWVKVKGGLPPWYTDADPLADINLYNEGGVWISA